MPDKIKIGTRKSDLAVIQAKKIAELLEANFPELNPELCLIDTTGDLVQDRPLYEIGGKDLFLKELEIALEQRRIDIAVHSLKDVTCNLREEFTLPLVLQREDPRDSFVGSRCKTLEDLPDDAKIGSTSLRRKYYLQKLFPDCQVLTVRGNLETRLRKIDEGKYDALVLAVSGLKRMGYENRITKKFSVREMVPAVGQGVIAVECLAAQKSLITKLKSLDCTNTRYAVECERAFLRKMNGNCCSPLGGLAEIDGEKIRLIAGYFSIQTGRKFFEEYEGLVPDSLQIGEFVAEKILNQLTEPERKELFTKL